VRAAFKAVEYGKQVAILVPTTDLAEQHERTFKDRFADYPFIVESIFQINGLGLIGLKAIRAGDTRLVLITILIPTFIAVIGNLLQDLAYVALDPRIDYGDRT
jgi:ABC-type microcin C transport system permease subunit YejB